MADKVKMLCMIQENALSKEQIKVLESKTLALYQMYFGKHQKIMPIWIIIPTGQAYIAAQTSTASTVTLPVADDTPNDIRHAFMHDFCHMWMAQVGCTENEIIFSVMDQYLSDEYRQHTIGRINPNGRRYQLMKLVLKMIKARLCKGYFSLNFNFNR